MFLTHFVGDIHQPLHSARASDRGGNSIDVTFDEYPSRTGSRLSWGRRHDEHSHDQHNHRHGNNETHHQWELHAVWDTGIIERAIDLTYNESRAALEGELWEYIMHAKETGELYKWLQCNDTRQHTCTTLWAEESFENALAWAYKNSDSSESEVTPGTHLSDNYYQTRLVKIKHFLSVAGARLAAALEIALAKSATSPNSVLTASL